MTYEIRNQPKDGTASEEKKPQDSSPSERCDATFSL